MSIYFSKVQYTQTNLVANKYSIILLDLCQKELSYQVFECKEKMPAIIKLYSFQIDSKIFYDLMSYPGKKIQSFKNSFRPELLPDTLYNEKLIFSYGMKLSEEQIKDLLPYCNPLDFEPYRNRKMSLDDEGYIGYRDQVRLNFKAISNSYFPKIEWDMDYYYDEKHIWPSEKLYRYLVIEFFQNNKNLKGWEINY